MAVLILTRHDVESLVSLDDCITGVENAFRAYGEGRGQLPPPLGLHVHGGGFHVKAARLDVGARTYFAAKLNANFPENFSTRGLPTIQGMAMLSDGTTGEPLAVMDSIGLTILRTGAATAVAARHLAAERPANVAIAGCGAQGRISLRALARVRPFQHVKLWDVDHNCAVALASDIAAELSCPVEVVHDFRAAAQTSDLIVTCTPSRTPLLGVRDVRPGAFVAAVGADNPEKQEIDPALLAHSVVIADIVDQCAAFGDLHHAIAAGLMRATDVRAELGQVINGTRPGRQDPREIVVFDSTGTALQDVAVAALAYERAITRTVGVAVTL